MSTAICALVISACGAADDAAGGPRPPWSSGDPTTAVAVPSPADPSPSVPGQADAVGGQRWSFHLVSHDGWEYDAMVVVDATYGFRKETSASPPGKAKLAAAVSGGANSIFTPTVHPGTAPQVAAVYGDANEGAWFAGPVGLSFSAGPCTTTATRPEGFPPVAFFCQITRGSMDSGTTEDMDEASVDTILRALRGVRPAYFEFGVGGIGRCNIGLFTDGRIATEYSADRKNNSCQVTGPGTVELEP